MKVRGPPRLPNFAIEALHLRFSVKIVEGAPHQLSASSSRAWGFGYSDQLHGVQALVHLLVYGLIREPHALALVNYIVSEYFLLKRLTMLATQVLVLGLK